MKRKNTTLLLCRAGIIAALYAVVTWAFGPLAFGPIQVRPSEALTLLPLFYIEAIPGLYIGCMLANLMSGYGLYDIFIGSLATLLAAILTYGTGKLIKNDILKVAVGGLFPVLCNAFIIPAVLILAGVPDIAYWLEFGIMAGTESLWIYAIGIPLYIAIKGIINKGVRVMQPLNSDTLKNNKNAEKI
ncbi:MAG: QueT transporter family protein [Candidatus Coproplasma sp.]